MKNIRRADIQLRKIKSRQTVNGMEPMEPIPGFGTN